MVADALSRIPGSEVIDCLKLCNMGYTFGMKHVDDLGEELSGKLCGM